MFKYRSTKRAHKKFQRAAERYKTFLDSTIEMGYGSYTNEEIVNAGREDLVAEEERLRERVHRATAELLAAYGVL